MALLLGSSQVYAETENIVLKKCGIKANASQENLTEKCVIPYLNGLWLSKKVMLRTKDMIPQEAKDWLLLNNNSTYPIFLPVGLDEDLVEDIKTSINKSYEQYSKTHIGNEKIFLNVQILPENKPKPHDHLYANLGLLYLPNAYEVPGGIFNEQYGWDTYFIVEGLLASAEYVLKHPDAKIVDFQSETNAPEYVSIKQLTNPFTGDKFSSEKELATTYFNIAKGMVDNHAFMINFYGGYILNGNRTYYLERSQPPFFIQSALAIYDFWTQNNKAVALPYKETLYPYLESLKDYPNGYKEPENYDQWIAYEILPAAIAYHQYWSDSQTYYDNWTPYYHNNPKNSPFFDSFTIQSDQKYSSLGVPQYYPNPRVVALEAEGNIYYGYRYYTEGEGPAPEAEKTLTGLQELYPNDARFFAAYPKQAVNPYALNTSFSTQELIEQLKAGKATKNLEWYSPTDYKKYNEIYTKEGLNNFGLSEAYFKSDRNIRASGYDTSGRFGVSGNYAAQFASVDLMSLLFDTNQKLNKIITNEKFVNDETESFLHNTLKSLQSETRFEKVTISQYQMELAAQAKNMQESLTPLYFANGYFSDRALPGFAIENGKLATSDDYIAKLKLAGISQAPHTYLYGSTFYPYAVGLKPRDDNEVSNWLNTVTMKKIITENSIAFPMFEKPIWTKKITNQKDSMISENGVNTSLVYTGNQWDYPYTWAPVNYFAMKSLINITSGDILNKDEKHIVNQALNKLNTAWINNVNVYFKINGVAVEKYDIKNPAGDVTIARGYSMDNQGFDWTNALYLMIINQKFVAHK